MTSTGALSDIHLSRPQVFLPWEDFFSPFTNHNSFSHGRTSSLHLQTMVLLKRISPINLMAFWIPADTPAFAQSNFLPPACLRHGLPLGPNMLWQRAVLRILMVSEHFKRVIVDEYKCRDTYLFFVLLDSNKRGNGNACRCSGSLWERITISGFNKTPI